MPTRRAIDSARRCALQPEPEPIDKLGSKPRWRKCWFQLARGTHALPVLLIVFYTQRFLLAFWQADARQWHTGYRGYTI